MGDWLAWMLQQSLPWLPAGLWCAWWLWGVNWKNAWTVLSRGGWVGVVLLTFLSALAWSKIFPRTFDFLGFSVPNFWWQLGASLALVLVALFCGWLQGKFGWEPPEVSFDPPAASPDHHGHAAHH
jgi:hypothetical protein